MIGSEWKPVPWWQAALFIGGPFLILMGLLMAFCSRPEPPTPVPSVARTAPAAIASSSSAATASQTVRISIRKPTTKQPRGSQATTSQEGAEATIEGGLVRLAPPETPDDEVITVEIAQTVSAAASSVASTGVSPEKEGDSHDVDHARLGVLIGPFPGAIALSYQLADVEIPPWVLGTPLEFGLDVEGNPLQIGAGLSVGGKAFASGGGYLSTTGPGWFLGLGLRF